MSPTAEALIVALGWESQLEPHEVRSLPTPELERALEILAQPGGTKREEALSRYAETEIKKVLAERAQIQAR